MPYFFREPKDGEPRNQVPEEGFESEEGWHEILNISHKFLTIYHFRLEYAIYFIEQLNRQHKSIKVDLFRRYMAKL